MVSLDTSTTTTSPYSIIMSDFKYNLVATPEGPISPGTCFFDTDAIYISPINNDGVNLGAYLSLWSTDAEQKAPIYLRVIFVDQGLTFDVTVTDVDNDVNDNGGYAPCVQFDIDTTTEFPDANLNSGVVAFELGLRSITADKPCGGLEVFTVSKEGEPACTNSITFQNTVTGRQFKFNSIDVGTYEFQFEGPGERYEIKWGDPQGCNPNEIDILNLVDSNNKRLRLEDYGAQDPSRWNFEDLRIEATYGEFEWDGEYKDPVFFITQIDGTLCPDGYNCENGECVKDNQKGSLMLDDLMLLHDAPTNELFHVRAGDFVTRSKFFNTPVIRGGVAYYTEALDCRILDTDAFPIYRPSLDANFQLTGAEFKRQFCYPNCEFEPGVRLYRKDPNGSGYNNQTFVIEFDPGFCQNQYDIEVFCKISHCLPPEKMNNTLNILVVPDDYFNTQEDLLNEIGQEGIKIPVGGDTWYWVGNQDALTFVQPGAQIVFESQGLAPLEGSGSEFFFSYGRRNLRGKITGTPNFSKPFTYVPDWQNPPAISTESPETPIYKIPDNTLYGFTNPDLLGNFQAAAQRIWIRQDGSISENFLNTRLIDGGTQKIKVDQVNMLGGEFIYTVTDPGVINPDDPNGYRWRTVGGSMKISHHFVNVGDGVVTSIDETLTNTVVDEAKHEFTFQTDANSYFSQSSGTQMCVYARAKYGQDYFGYARSNYLAI